MRQKLQVHEADVGMMTIGTRIQAMPGTRGHRPLAELQGKQATDLGTINREDRLWGPRSHQ